MTLIHSAWQAAQWPDGVDCIITDPPYSERTHKGQVDVRRGIDYASLSPNDVREWTAAWVPRVRYWLAVMCDHALIPAWESAMQAAGLYAFAPVPCVITGMTCRIAGDGPSSWAVYLMVGRTKAAHKWGTLPGAYVVSADRNRAARIGGKPLDLMQQIVRDYSRPGMLVADPCAGHATTLVAAKGAGRRVWGCEADADAHRAGLERLTLTPAPSLSFDAPEQTELL